MKLINGIVVLALMGALSSCSTPASRGRSAGEDYCECNRKDGIFNVGKCKKDVLKEHRDDLLNEEFQSAFWDAVADCDE